MRIVVVGAGIVGAACARALATTGFDVSVSIEVRSPGGRRRAAKAISWCRTSLPGPSWILRC